MFCFRSNEKEITGCEFEATYIPMSSPLLSLFNDTFESLLSDMCAVFPEHRDLRTAQTTVATVRKANPKLLLTQWKQHVQSQYKDALLAQNVTFFLEKDYTEDVTSSSVLAIIDDMRVLMRELSPDNKATVAKYLQNLCVLCDRIG